MVMTAEQFSNVREDLGMTQSELGVRIGGYALRTVQSWESGERSIPPSVEALIAAWDEKERLMEAVMNLLTKRPHATVIAKEEIELAAGMEYSQFLKQFKERCYTLDGISSVGARP